MRGSRAHSRIFQLCATRFATRPPAKSNSIAAIQSSPPSFLLFGNIIERLQKSGTHARPVSVSLILLLSLSLVLSLACTCSCSLCFSIFCFLSPSRSSSCPPRIFRHPAFPFRIKTSGFISFFLPAAAVADVLLVSERRFAFLLSFFCTTFVLSSSRSLYTTFVASRRVAFKEAPRFYFPDFPRSLLMAIR